MSSGRRWKYRIRHILDAIDRIEAYTADLDAEGLAEHHMALDAVIRNFQVIGEAARKVPKEIQQAHSEIPWSDMQKMRHVVVHDYDNVNISTLWDTIRNDLPPIVEPLKKLLKEAEE